MFSGRVVFRGRDMVKGQYKNHYVNGKSCMETNHQKSVLSCVCNMNLM